MNDSRGRNKNGPGLSRRDFLRGSGAAAAATALAQAPLPAVGAPGESAAQVPAMGPGPITVSFSVNGQSMTQQFEPRVTLLDALRNYLDVTGCKRVCDRGSCGACTVLLDSQPVYSCSMLAVEAQGRAVETAEGLAAGGKLDPVPAAFVRHDAQQCGFCTPGFVVAMRAAFNSNPNATPKEVEEALAGNICRCGTYQQMREAIASLCKNTEKRG